MYSPVNLCFLIGFLLVPKIGAGGGVLLSLREFFILVDEQLILPTNNTVDPEHSKSLAIMKSWPVQEKLGPTRSCLL